MTTVTDVSSSELLAVVAARELAGRQTVFAGIGLPTLAVSLAQLTVAPDAEIVYESGVCGAHPTHLPETIADSVLITGAEAVLSLPALFGYVLQGGRIDVGFLGAAQIDRWGNLNSSVIGDWHAPKVRLPGSGGAVEVMANAREVFVVMRRHDRRSLVETLDFCTSPGPDRAAAAGLRPARAGGTGGGAPPARGRGHPGHHRHRHPRPRGAGAGAGRAASGPRRRAGPRGHRMGPEGRRRPGRHRAAGRDRAAPAARGRRSAPRLPALTRGCPPYQEEVP